jgi:hypothetical protein
VLADLWNTPLPQLCVCNGRTLIGFPPLFRPYEYGSRYVVFYIHGIGEEDDLGKACGVEGTVSSCQILNPIRVLENPLGI